MTRIVLVDDHEIVRRGIRGILVEHPGFQVVGEAGDYGELRRVLKEHPADVLVMDIGLPGKSGVGGGLIAVAPGQFGIGTFSTKLDAAGNSIRGQRAITDINNTLGTNPLAQFG